MPKNLLEDILSNKNQLSIPSALRSTLQDVAILSQDYADCVFDLSMATTKDPNHFCIQWNYDPTLRSSVVAFIAQDLTEGHYFDFMQHFMGNDVRFNHGELVEYFREQFERTRALRQANLKYLK